MNAPHADRAHAEYAPSAAYRWMRCPGSVEAAEKAPPAPASVYAEEGTACHEVASLVLNGEDFEETCRSYDLSPDQRDIVTEYVDFCFFIEEEMGRYGRPKILVERRMAARTISHKFFGTGDFIAVAGGVLRVIDLKAGAMPVYVRDRAGHINPQLASYVLLALATLGAPVSAWSFDPGAIGIHQIKLTIVQPRVYDAPQSTVVEIAELQEFLDELMAAIDRIEGGDRTRVAGEWCRFCPAKGLCPELRAQAVQRARMDFASDNIPFEEWAAILAEAATIAAHVDGIRQKIRHAVEQGKTVPGFKLVAKRALKRWHSFEQTAEKLMGRGFPRSDLYRETPASPAAVLKAWKRYGLDPENFREHYYTAASGVTVVPEEDPRPAIVYQPGACFEDESEEN